MNKYKTLFNNTLIFALCNFTSKLLVFIMLPFYTMALSKEEFGTADIFSSTVNLLNPILTIAIAEACLRFALDKAKDVRQVFSIGIKTLLIGFLLMIIASPFIRRLQDIGPYTIYFILLYITTILGSFLNYFARGIQKVRLLGIAGVVSAFTVVICNVVLLFVFHFGVSGYLISMIAGHVASICILVFGGKIWRYYTRKTSKDLTVEMFKYSVPLVPNKLSWWINHVSNRYIINFYCGIGDVGLYSAASRMPSIINTFRGVFIEAWQLSMITEYKEKNSDAFFNNIFRVYKVFLLLLCSGLIVLSKLIGSVLFSKEFFEAWIYTPLLLLGMFYLSLVSFYSPIYLAHKKTNKLFLFTLAGAITTLVCNFVIVPWIGISGAAVASVVSSFVIYISMSIDSKKYLKLTSDKVSFKISYIILSVQAFLVSFFVINPMGFFSVLMLAIIIILNFSEMKEMVTTLWKIAKSKISRK